MTFSRPETTFFAVFEPEIMKNDSRDRLNLVLRPLKFGLETAKMWFRDQLRFEMFIDIFEAKTTVFALFEAETMKRKKI